MKLDTVTRYLREFVRRTEVGHLTAAEVHARLGEPDFHLFDCNLELTWRLGHLPGAVYARRRAGGRRTTARRPCRRPRARARPGSIAALAAWALRVCSPGS